MINLDTGETFTTIQSAIDDSNTLNGHTIYVYSGTYYEQLSIFKSITLIGEDKDTTIIDAEGTGEAVYINGDGIKIQGFTIKNTKSNYGIYLHMYCDNNILTGNNIIDCSEGIHLHTHSSNNEISNNIFEYNTFSIKFVFWAEDNVIKNNIMKNNGYGIKIIQSDKNTIENNYCTDNQNNDVSTELSKELTIIDNQFLSNSIYGVYIDGTMGDDNNTIENNIITNNSETGLLLDSVDNSKINNNTIYDSKHGIYFDGCFDNIVMGNNLSENDYNGIVSYNSHRHLIYNNNFYSNYYYAINIGNGGNHKIYHNNFVNNSDPSSGMYDEQCYDLGESDWNSTTIMEGNYWDDFDEPSEGAFDNDLDGIIDSSYNVPYYDVRNIDLYPLASPYTSN